MAHNIDALVHYIKTETPKPEQIAARRAHAHPQAAQEIAAYIMRILQGADAR